MKKIVALEEGLSNSIRPALEKEGYTVVQPGYTGNIDAIVISGLDKDVMGMQDKTVKSVVIDANGKTPEEVLKDLKNRL